MLTSIMAVISALWHQDFGALMAMDSHLLIYIVVAMLIFLESGFIPAAPLPCDSVVLLSGTLAASGVLDPVAIMVVITTSAALGTWVGYWQGTRLNRLPKVQGWVNAVPVYRLQQVDNLLGKHGLVALFCARFVPVVRSLLPLMMGLRAHRVLKFHTYAWLSAALWTLLLCGMGLMIPLLPEKLRHLATAAIMIAPLITLGFAVLSFAFIKLRKYWTKRPESVSEEI